jgi:hypothetical protein
LLCSFQNLNKTNINKSAQKRLHELESPTIGHSDFDVFKENERGSWVYRFKK